jgi:hypothetical protein
LFKISIIAVFILDLASSFVGATPCEELSELPSSSLESYSEDSLSKISFLSTYSSSFSKSYSLT